MRALIRIYSSSIARTVKVSPVISSFQYTNIAVVAVKPAVEYSFVLKSVQTWERVNTKQN